MKVTAGVDCHKRFHVVAFIDAVGKLIETLQIPATASGYASAIAHSRRYASCTWGLEGAHSYGHGFADALLADGACVYEVPGAFTKRHRRFSSRPHKSDRADAQAIAEAVLRERERLPRFQVIGEQEALRMRYDQRSRMVGRRTEVVNRLRAAAVRLAIDDLPKDVTSERGLAAARRAAVSRVGESAAIDAFVDEIRLAVDEIARLNAEIRRIEQILRPSVERVGRELLQLYGVKTVLCAGLIGHAGNMRNCRDSDAFAMRSGTAPVSCSSGRNQAVRVNCGGNRQLNKMLHQIATTQLRVPDHAGRQYFERKLREGKTPKQARRCLKRRLATIVYYRLVAAQRELDELRPAA